MDQFVNLFINILITGTYVFTIFVFISRMPYFLHYFIEKKFCQQTSLFDSNFLCLYAHVCLFYRCFFPICVCAVLQVAYSHGVLASAGDDGISLWLPKHWDRNTYLL